MYVMRSNYITMIYSNIYLVSIKWSTYEVHILLGLSMSQYPTNFDVDAPITLV